MPASYAASGVLAANAHPHNQRGRSGQAGDKIHRGIRLRVGPCKTEEYYAGKNGGACLNNL